MRTPKLPDVPSTEDEGAGSNVKPSTTTSTPAKTGAGGGVTPAPKQPPPAKPEDEFEALAKRFEALKKR